MHIIVKNDNNLHHNFCGPLAEDVEVHGVTLAADDDQQHHCGRGLDHKISSGYLTAINKLIVKQI
jgi:hypothetical protein